MVAQGALGPQMRGLGLAACPVAELPRPVALALRADAGQFRLDPGDRLVAAGLVALGLVGVVADDKPLLGAVQADLLDPQVVADLLVAALPGERGLDLGVAVA